MLTSALSCLTRQLCTTHSKDDISKLAGLKQQISLTLYPTIWIRLMWFTLCCCIMQSMIHIACDRHYTRFRMLCDVEYDSHCVKVELQEPQRGSIETLCTPAVKRWTGTLCCVEMALFVLTTVFSIAVFLRHVSINQFIKSERTKWPLTSQYKIHDIKYINTHKHIW